MKRTQKVQGKQYRLHVKTGISFHVPWGLPNYVSILYLNKVGWTQKK